MNKFHIIKSSGDIVPFSSKKVARSLQRSGADPDTIDMILKTIKNEIYEGITTKEVYNRAFQLLKQKDRILASRYKLKKAIFELGPTGFPFERFIAAIFKKTGYKVEVGSVLNGTCVSHEIDVIAKQNDKILLMECKFHSLEDKKTDVKVPLYIHSRFNDIKAFQQNNGKPVFSQGWVVTNTKFTEDARQYANCVGIQLMSWNQPKGQSLKDRIDHTGLYPITVSTLLTKKEKQFLLNHDIVLCKELVQQSFYLSHLGISENRTRRILKEMRNVCEAHI